MLGPDVLILESNGRASSPATLVWVLHVAFPLTLAVVAFVRAAVERKRARHAAREYVASAPLVQGPQVVHGAVEYEDGATSALEVVISQEGREWQRKSRWHHSWTESSRTTMATPFYVADDRGRIRIEPDQQTLLVDKLDETKREGATRRKRIARLDNGEKVFVAGRLFASGGGDSAASAYRASPRTYVMRPPRNRPLLCSTEPLEARFAERAAKHRALGIAFVCITVFLAAIDYGYHLRTLRGVRETATIVSAKRITGKGSRCALELRTESGDEFSDDVPLYACNGLRAGQRMAVINPRSGGWFAHVGTEPALSISAIVAGTFLVVVAAAIYAFRNRPWYESPVVDHGTGRLA